jgi:gliding motility-associated-like protein
MRYTKIMLLFLVWLFSTFSIKAQSACIVLSSGAGTDDQKVCVNSPITQITYTLGAGVTSASITGLPAGVNGVYSPGSFIINGTPLIAGTYTYTINTIGICSGLPQTSGRITVNAVPSAVITYSGNPFCNSLSAPQQVSLTGTPGGVYTSAPAGLAINSGTGAITPSASIPGTYVVTYSVTVAGCGAASATASVTITLLPVATFSYPGSPYCSNESDPLPTFSGGGVAGIFSSTAGLVFINTTTGQVDLSASIPGTYTVTNTIAAAGGCGIVTASALISVTGLPVATFSYSDTPYCNNEPDPFPTYSGGGGPGLFSSTAGLVFVSNLTGQVDLSASKPGTYTVNNTRAAAGGCGSVSSTNTITITAMPSASISYPGNPYCSSVTVTIPVTLTGTPGGQFSAIPSGLTINSTTGAIIPGTSTTGTYTVIYTISAAGGCGVVTATATVSINPTPTLIITNPAALCYPATVNLTDAALTSGSTPGLTFTYWRDAAATIVYSTPLTATSGTYYIKGTASTGCYDIKPVVVTINPSPIASASNNGPVCEGSLLNLVGGPSLMKTYLWTGPNGFISGQMSPIVSESATSLIAGLYTITVTNEFNCQSSASTTVNVYAVPVSNAGQGGSECDLDFALNAIPSVGTGLWDLFSGPGTAVFSPNANSSSAIVTVSAYGTYIFRWTETNSVCSSSSLVTVTFSQQPTANPGNGGDECDLNFQLSAVPSIGVGTWTMTNGTGTAAFNPSANSPSAVVEVSEYGTKEFTWIELNGTCSDTAVITVNFYEQPVANPGSGGNNCGLDYNLRAIPSIGTGAWTLESGPGPVSFSPDPNTFAARVTVVQYGNYVFRWTEVNGTCSSSGTVSVTFIEQPSANAGNGGDECDLDFVLNAVHGTGTGIWTKVSGPGNVIFSPDAGQNNAVVTVSQYGIYDFAWTESNSLCASSDIVRVTFHDLPQVNAGPDVLLCKDRSVQLGATGSGSFLWSPSGSLNNPNIYNPIARPEVTTVYTVTVTDPWGCKNSDQINVEVRNQPVANAGPDQLLEFIFETEMQALEPGSDQTGEWTLLEGEAEISDINSATSLVSDLAVGINRFMWTVTNGVCPAATDVVLIKVENLKIPTLITPNLDGNNDVFLIRGIETMGKTSLTVFNRWGARVFENINYDNNWDGVDDKKHPLPDDTYFYILRSELRSDIKGYVVIRR